MMMDVLFRTVKAILRQHMGFARMLVLGAVVFAPRASAAQERAGSIYLTAGIAVFHQSGPSGDVTETYVTAPGGTTVGWLVGGGVSVTKGASVDVDLSRTGLMTAREASRYGQTFTEERRDRYLALAVRLAFPAAGTIRVEPVVGMVLTYPQAESQTRTVALGPTPAPPVDGPTVTHQLETSAGLVVGVDVRLGNRRVAIVPSFRVADIGVSHGKYDETSERREISAIYPGGYPRWSIRSGVALRVDF